MFYLWRLQEIFDTILEIYYYANYYTIYHTSGNGQWKQDNLYPWCYIISSLYCIIVCTTPVAHCISCTPVTLLSSDMYVAHGTYTRPYDTTTLPYKYNFKYKYSCRLTWNKCIISTNLNTLSKLFAPYVRRLINFVDIRYSLQGSQLTGERWTLRVIVWSCSSLRCFQTHSAPAVSIVEKPYSLPGDPYLHSPGPGLLFSPSPFRCPLTLSYHRW